MATTYRNFFYQVHLWTGMIAALVIIPLGLTGSYLVWHIEIDSYLHPDRAVVSHSTVELTAEQYMAAAAQAFPAAIPAGVAIPVKKGEAVNVFMIYPKRAEPGAQQARIFTWIDPGSGQIIGHSDARSSFIAWAHRFHFYLNSHPETGRQMVGIAGIMLLVSSLTAIWLWWPKKIYLWRSLKWQKRARLSQNLHFVFGIWVLLPMLLLSVSGIYLSFPQASAQVVGAFMTIKNPIAVTEPLPVRTLVSLHLAPSEVVEIAIGSASTDSADLFLTGLGIPSVGSENWTVRLRQAQKPPLVLLVQDDTGKVTRAEPPNTPFAGDTFTHFMHMLHDGAGLGLFYRVIITVAGLLPLGFLVTGVILWLRRRRLDKRRRLASEPS